MQTSRVQTNEDESSLLLTRCVGVGSGFAGGSPNSRKAPSVTGKNYEDLYRLAAANGWPGYFGAPRLASAAFGAEDYAEQSRRLTRMALQILDGLDYRKIPRFADDVDPRDAIGRLRKSIMHAS
jgi:hypothetical protein